MLEGIPKYRVKDYDNEEINGTWYTRELQRVYVDPDQVFNIEKILKKRRNSRGEKEILVRWQGYPPKFDSWILESNAKDI
jgi:hypothetical protein